VIQRSDQTIYSRSHIVERKRSDMRCLPANLQDTGDRVHHSSLYLLGRLLQHPLAFELQLRCLHRLPLGIRTLSTPVSVPAPTLYQDCSTLLRARINLPETEKGKMRDITQVEVVRQSGSESASEIGIVTIMEDEAEIPIIHLDLV
jgi:hypothetical protein